MAISTKGDKYLGKVSSPVLADKGMQVKDYGSMDYLEKREYLRNKYYGAIKRTEFGFTIYGSDINVDFLNDTKKERDKLIKEYELSADYTEDSLKENTNYRVEGFYLQKTDDGEDYYDMDEESSDNTYNADYSGLIDLQYRLYEDDGRYLYLITPHLGGDPRGNYGDGFIIEGDDKEDLFYRFYEEFIDGSAYISVEFKDGSQLNFSGTSAYGTYEFEFDEYSSEIKSKLAQELVDTFESLDRYDADEFLEELATGFAQRKTSKYMGGGEINEQPSIYVEVLGTDKGKWVNISDALDGAEVMQDIQDIIDEAGGEEYRIADMEGFAHDYFYEQYMSETDFDSLLTAYNKWKDTDFPVDLVVQFAEDNRLDLEDALNEMEETYVFEFDDYEEFGRHLVDNYVVKPSANELYMTETDVRVISNDEADAQYNNMSDDEVIEYADAEKEYEEEESNIKKEIEELKEEVNVLDDELSNELNDAEYDKIQDAISDKESEIEELEDKLFSLEDTYVDKYRNTVINKLVDEISYRLENELQEYLDELGYNNEDYGNIDWLSIDYEGIGQDTASDYIVYEIDDTLYIFNDSYGNGGSVKSIGKPAPYDFYIVEKNSNKIISGHNRKKEALAEKSKLKEKHKNLNLDVYSKIDVIVELDIDNESFDSFAKPESFEYGGNINLRSNLMTPSEDDELWKTSQDIRNKLSVSRLGLNGYSDTERKNLRKQLGRINATNYLKNGKFWAGAVVGAMSMAQDSKPNAEEQKKAEIEKQKKADQRLKTASRTVDNVKDAGQKTGSWLKKQWQEADFGDGKGKAKFKVGGYVRGEEILFDDNGKERTGIVTDVLGDNDYAVFSDSGWSMSQVLVNDDQIIGYAPEYQRKKFLGVFNEGGSLDRKYDTLVDFSSIGDRHNSINYLGIIAKSESEAIEKAKQKFYDTDAKKFNSPYVTNVETWDRGVIDTKLAGGGSIEKQNKSMLENDAVQIEHHSEELNKVVPKTNEVPAWVIGKTSRINSDLSDVTHYLDGKSQVKKKFNSGGTLELSREKAKKVFHLPFESAIYVPSTSNVDEVISPEEMQSRVQEVQKYLGNLFGGYTSSETMGGFVDSQGNLVNEDVVKVTSFAEKDTFNEKKEEVLNKLADWSKHWGQEAMGFEFEGDLYYVPANYKKGGVLFTPKGREIIFQDENVALEHNKISDHYSLRDSKTGNYMDDGGFISDYLYYDSVAFNEGGGVGELQAGDVITFMEGEQKVIRPIKEIKEENILVVQLSKDEFLEITSDRVIDVKRKETPYDIIKNKIGLPDYIANYLVEKSKKYAVWLADSIKDYYIEKEKRIYPDKSDKELLKELIDKGDFKENNFEPIFTSQINPIIDWLDFPLTPNQNLRETSFKDAMEKSEEWHNQLESKGGDINYVEPDTNLLIKEYEPTDKGVVYYWTKIPSNFCRLESDRMGHCGRTSHSSLISLRSRTPLRKDEYLADSHVTIAFGNDGKFYQVKGKKNQKPSQKYHSYIVDLIGVLIEAERNPDEIDAQIQAKIDAKANPIKETLLSDAEIEELYDTRKQEYDRKIKSEQEIQEEIRIAQQDINEKILSQEELEAKVLEQTSVLGENIDKVDDVVKKAEQKLEEDFDNISMDEYEERLIEIEQLKRENNKPLLQRDSVRRDMIEKNDLYKQQRSDIASQIERRNNILIREKEELRGNIIRDEESKKRQIRDIEESMLGAKLQFTGFGSEYAEVEDFGLEDMNNNQKAELLKIKPEIFNTDDLFSLLESGQIEFETIKNAVEKEVQREYGEVNIKNIEKYLGRRKYTKYIEAQGKEVFYDDTFTITIPRRQIGSDLQTFLSTGDWDADMLYNAYTGEDTHTWFDGSYGYYAETGSEFLDNFNKENQQKMIDFLKEQGLTDEDIEEAGGLEFLIDEYDELQSAVARALTDAEESAMVGYYNKQINSALKELFDSVEFDGDNLILKGDLSDMLDENQIDYYEERVGEDRASMFDEAIGRGDIDKPSLFIDDRYTDTDDPNEFFEI